MWCWCRVIPTQSLQEPWRLPNCTSGLAMWRQDCAVLIEPCPKRSTVSWPTIFPIIFLHPPKPQSNTCLTKAFLKTGSLSQATLLWMPCTRTLRSLNKPLIPLRTWTFRKKATSSQPSTGLRTRTTGNAYPAYSMASGRFTTSSTSQLSSRPTLVQSR